MNRLDFEFITRETMLLEQDQQQQQTQEQKQQEWEVLSHDEKTEPFVMLKKHNWLSKSCDDLRSLEGGDNRKTKRNISPDRFKSNFKATVSSTSTSEKGKLVAVIGRDKKTGELSVTPKFCI